MNDRVEFVFWTEPYRLLSTGPAGTTCGSRAEAIMRLFDQIASHETNIGYLNDIYDNAQVELQSDNMEQITVLDYFDVRDIYLNSDSLKSTATFTYTPTGKDSVGLAYEHKQPTGPEPKFQEALAALNATVAERDKEYREEQKR